MFFRRFLVCLLIVLTYCGVCLIVLLIIFISSSLIQSLTQLTEKQSFGKRHIWTFFTDFKCVVMANQNVVTNKVIKMIEYTHTHTYTRHTTFVVCAPE